MAAVAGKKFGSAFSNAIEKIEITYDFAVDGGATGALDMFEAVDKLVIHRSYVKCMTTCTSGGSATVIMGVIGGDTDAILTSTAVASLVADTAFDNDSASDALFLAAGGKLGMTIGTAALTAGKLILVLHVSKF